MDTSPAANGTSAGREPGALKEEKTEMITQEFIF